MKRRYCLLPLAICLLISCASFKDLPIQKGILITNGVTITAEDGSFSIKAGEPFIPPFQMGGFWWGTDRNVSRNLLHWPDSVIAKNGKTFNDLYGMALEAGAKKVLVQMPDFDKPLYGILALFTSVEMGASTPPPDFYSIQIPQQYAEAALNGKISVIYVSYVGDPQEHTKPKSWALWLSSAPFPPLPHQ